MQNGLNKEFKGDFAMQGVDYPGMISRILFKFILEYSNIRLFQLTFYRTSSPAEL